MERCAVVSLLVACLPLVAQQKPQFLFAYNNSAVKSIAVDPNTGALSETGFEVPVAYVNVYHWAAFDPSGRFAYFVDSGTNTIIEASIDPTNGALTPVPGSPVSVPGTVAALAMAPSGHYLFASVSSVDSGFIYAYSADANSGALTLSHVTSVPGAPYDLAIDPSGKFLVSTAGTPVSYKINPQTGSLAQTGSATGYEAYYVAFSGSGNVYGSGFYWILGYALNPQSGALSGLHGFPYYFPQGWAAPFGTDPTGRFLYVLANTNNVTGIFGWAINAQDGSLQSALPGSPFIGGGGLAVDQYNRFIYTNDPYTGELIGYTIDSWSGTLTPLPPSTIIGYSQVFSPPATTLSGTLESLSIQPATATVTFIPPGIQQFTATGAYSNGTSRYLTSSVTWTSSDTSLLTFSTDPAHYGQATIKGPGTVDVTASFGGLSATATITLVRKPLSAIAVTPASASVQAHTALQFTATGTYQDGTVADITDYCTWTSSDNSIATVRPHGIAAGKAPGTATITASSGSFSASGTLTVQ